MPELDATLVTVLADRYASNLARVCELAGPLTDKQFWTKPFPYGNSFGHLVLHLTGNLSYYIGAQIAETGYVRDRAREFTEPNPPSKEEALKRLNDAVEMVIKTIWAQSSGDWRSHIRQSAQIAVIVSTWSCSAPLTCSITSAK